MPSFVKIDQVVSEEKIKMWKANDDGRRTLSGSNSSHDLWSGELKKWMLKPTLDFHSMINMSTIIKMYQKTFWLKCVILILVYYETFCVNATIFWNILK